MNAYQCRDIRPRRRIRISPLSTLWKDILAGVDAVMSAAGAVRGRTCKAFMSPEARALYAAGVRRVIRSSATGTDRDARSDFSRTKHQGEPP
jgi:uncharacterized protein YbjT (DUF2867 family)